MTSSVVVVASIKNIVTTSTTISIIIVITIEISIVIIVVVIGVVQEAISPSLGRYHGSWLAASFARIVELGEGRGARMLGQLLVE